MKIRLLFCLIILSISTHSQNKQGIEKENVNKSDLKEYVNSCKSLSQTLVDAFNAGDYSSIAIHFNEEISKGLSAEKLKSTWESLTKTYGSFIGIGKQLLQERSEANYFISELNFDKMNFDLLIALDRNSKISIFRLLPAINKETWEAPSYVDFSKIEREKIKVPGEWPLLGEYVHPIDDTKREAIVVFVHGSGPNDMDGTLGPNKIFKDLAYGLGSYDIASIRYNKVSYDYQNSLAKKTDVDIDFEVCNDAAAAVKFAKTLGYKKVILVGHSLGGHMAPKINHMEKADGIILMAGNSSNLVDVIVPQLEYLMKNDSTTQLTEFQLNLFRNQVKNVKEKNYDKSTTGFALPFGASGYYWASLDAYSATKMAKKQASPFLILNGERDYQVNVAEAKAWKNGNSNKASKTIIYPGLNHMFFSGKGVLLPAEYENKAHVEEKVILDMKDWILTL